ncbi:hypothetical protein M0804_006508 [Polistes exclamans]|nr:hypothetical protein M0804_006508 [Polistes exclamans]
MEHRYETGKQSCIRKMSNVFLESILPWFYSMLRSMAEALLERADDRRIEITTRPSRALVVTLSGTSLWYSPLDHLFIRDENCGSGGGGGGSGGGGGGGMVQWERAG